MWSPSKSKRFVVDHYSNLNTPPPGTYNPSDTDSVNGYGTYILSTFKTLGTKRFKQFSNKKLKTTAHDGLFPPSGT